jgi:hypothetical protein
MIMNPLITPAAFDDYLIHTTTGAGLQRNKVQWIYRFPNGLGASILDGEEVGVIQFGDGDPADVFYWYWADPAKTGITTQHGIIRVSTDEQISDLLNRIKEVEV